MSFIASTVKRRTHQNFCGALIRALIEESADAPTPHRGRGKKGEPLRRLTERHFPAFNSAKPGAKRKRPLRDCKVCNPTKQMREGFKRKQTAYCCSVCDISHKDFKSAVSIDNNSESDTD